MPAIRKYPATDDAMAETIRREYPTGDVDKLAGKLGLSRHILKHKAGQLGVKRNTQPAVEPVPAIDELHEARKRLLSWLALNGPRTIDDTVSHHGIEVWMLVRHSWFEIAAGKIEITSLGWIQVREERSRQ